MSVQTQQIEKVRRLGGAYGHELAAALVLASSRNGADRALKQEMSRIVLRQIAVAVEKLEKASFPPELVALYERAARDGVRDELQKSLAIAA